MADPTGASAPTKIDSVKDAEGAAISLSVAYLFVRKHHTAIRQGFHAVVGEVEDIGYWARIQWSHNLVVFQRRAAMMVGVFTLLFHLLVMKVVSLECAALGRPIPSGMWSFWGWLLAAVEGMFIVGILSSVFVKRIEDVDAYAKLDSDAARKKHGGNNSSPFFLGLWYTAATILAGFTFLAMYSMLGWYHGKDLEHGLGLLYRLCYLHFIWLPLLGMALGIVVPFAIIKAMEMFIGGVVGRAAGFLGNLILTVTRSGLAAALPGVTGDNVDTKVKGDVMAELAELGWVVVKATNDLLGLALIVAVWCMVGSFWLIPMTVGAGAVISGITSILRGKYRLGTLFVEQRRLLLNLAVLGPVFVFGVVLNASPLLHAVWVGVLVKLALLGNIVFYTLAGLVLAAFIVAVSLWASLHRAHEKKQDAATLAAHPIPRAVEKSTLLYGTMLATGALAVLLAGFAFTGYCLATGDYSKTVVAAADKPEKVQLTARSRRPGELEVKWKRVEGAQKYRLELFKKEDSNHVVNATEVDWNEEPSKTFHLVSEQAYIVEVTSVGRFDESDPQRSGSVTIMKGAPAPADEKKADDDSHSNTLAQGGAHVTNDNLPCCKGRVEAYCREEFPECFH